MAVLAAGGSDGGVVRALAAVAMELRASPLRDDAAVAAERAVIDWFGVALGGSAEVPARALVAGMGPLTGPSRLVGPDQSAPPQVAALINGTAAHTLELDDIYAPGLCHPGAPTIAAALAVADQVDATGEAFLRAVVTGYEIGCRVAADLGPAHYKHWHTTGTAGALGAAAAAAEVLGADEGDFANALALAATMSAGLQQTFRSDAMGKPLHAGNAAHAGVIAAIAAIGGVTGAADVLEGDAGLGAATGSAPDWARSRAPVDAAVAAAGSALAVCDVTVKPYPCCGHTFAVIDAVLRLRAEGLRAGEVHHLEVATYGTAIAVAGIIRPRTPAERRFSIPYLAAAALVDGDIGEDSLEPGADRAELAELTGKVAMALDPVFEGAFPARRGARVSAVTVSGATVTVVVPDRSGSPENPLSAERVERKFLSTSAVAAGDRGPDLLRQIKALRNGGYVRQVPLGRD